MILDVLSYGEYQEATIAIQCPRTRHLLQQRFDGLRRHHVVGPQLLYVFERGIVTEMGHRDAVLDPYFQLFRDSVVACFTLML